jgi:hypothetical protein
MSWETLLLHATQPFVEFLQVRQKPHLGATVGFVHKIFERAALSHVSRDVAQDHEEPSVRHEFLNAVTRKTCLESDLRQIILARGTEALSINYQRKELAHVQFG